MSGPLTFRGRETTAKALGREWTFDRWSYDTLNDFLAWAKTKLPDPIEVAIQTLERMELEERSIQDPKRLTSRAKIKDELLANAQHLAGLYLDLSGPAVTSLLNSPMGLGHLMLLLLKKHHPDVTEEVAFEIAMNMPDGEQKRVMETTSGKAPPAPKNGSPPAAGQSPRRRG